MDKIKKTIRDIKKHVNSLDSDLYQENKLIIDTCFASAIDIIEKNNIKTDLVAEPRFPIDFFEFSFLVEACIPPRPIARAMFWKNVIDIHFHKMTPVERDNLFEWVNRCNSMIDGIENGNEDCLLFNARFDKENQYIVTTKYNGEIANHTCFKWLDKYHTTISRSVFEEYIIAINKLNF